MAARSENPSDAGADDRGPTGEFDGAVPTRLRGEGARWRERSITERSVGGAAGGDQPAGNTTRNAILEVTLELLDERGADGFTIDDVLVASGASASSLYHHFRNRAGLLVAAQAERYRRTAKQEDRRNLDGGQMAGTTEEFFAYVALQLRRIVTDPANREVRRSRLQVAARALDAPELAAKTRRSQEAMLDVITAMFDDAQARGLINRDLDTRAYCAWFHGMTLGRTFTEGGPIDAEAWLQIAVPAALASLRPSPPAAAPAPGQPGVS